MFEASADGWGLSDWRNVIAVTYGFDDPPSSPPESETYESDMNKAIEASLSDQTRTKRPAPQETDDDEQITKSPPKIPKTRIPVPENGLPIRTAKDVTVSRHHGRHPCLNRKSGGAGQAPSETISTTPAPERGLYNNGNGNLLDDDASAYNGPRVSPPVTSRRSSSNNDQPTDSTEYNDELYVCVSCIGLQLN